MVGMMGQCCCSGGSGGCDSTYPCEADQSWIRPVQEETFLDSFSSVDPGWEYLDAQTPEVVAEDFVRGGRLQATTEPWSPYVDPLGFFPHQMWVPERPRTTPPVATTRNLQWVKFTRRSNLYFPTFSYSEQVQFQFPEGLATNHIKNSVCTTRFKNGALMAITLTNEVVYVYPFTVTAGSIQGSQQYTPWTFGLAIGQFNSISNTTPPPTPIWSRVITFDEPHVLKKTFTPTIETVGGQDLVRVTFKLFVDDVEVRQWSSLLVPANQSTLCVRICNQPTALELRYPYSVNPWQYSPFVPNGPAWVWIKPGVEFPADGCYWTNNFAFTCANPDNQCWFDDYRFERLSANLP